MKNIKRSKMLIFIEPFLLCLSLLNVTALMFILSGCMVSGKIKEKEVQDKSTGNPEYNVYTIKGIKTHREITGLGNLEVMDKATVVSRIDGILQKVYVKKGDEVKKRAPLFYVSNYNLEIENAKAEKALTEAREELETANIQYSEAKKNLYKKFIQLEKKKMEIINVKKEITFMNDAVKKKELLLKKGGITQEAYDGFAFSLKAKKRNLEIMKKEYELEIYGFTDKDIVDAGYKLPTGKEKKREILIYINTELQRRRIKFAELSVKKALLDRDRTGWLMEQRMIRSPTDGVVTDIGKFTGEKINADEALTTIINLKSLVARVAFSERDIRFFKVGSSVSIEIEGDENLLPGTIYTVDPYVDRETRSVKVDCLINNYKNNRYILLPGMFIKVRVPTDSISKKLLIPKDSLIADKNNAGYVYVVSHDSRVYRRQILYADFDNRNYMVLNGVNENDTIILNPDDSLRDGMKIKIKI